MITITVNLSQIIRFLLVLCRVGGVLAVAPLVGSERVPARVKAALAVMISIVLAPLAADGALDTGAPGLVLAACGELVLGLAIGFGARIIFAVVQMAGEMADAQAAFGFAGLVSPDTGGRTSVIGQLQMSLAWLIFLAANGHHIILRGLAQSLAAVPLAGGPGLCAPALTSATAQLIATAVRMAAPVVGATLLADLALGLLTRAAPQMNLLAIGFPIKLAVGLIAALLALPLLGNIVRVLLGMMPDIMHSVLLSVT